MEVGLWNYSVRSAYESIPGNVPKSQVVGRKNRVCWGWSFSLMDYFIATILSSSKKRSFPTGTAPAVSVCIFEKAKGTPSRGVGPASCGERQGSHSSDWRPDNPAQSSSNSRSA